MDPSLAPLALLGDSLLRAQELTGTGTVPPSGPIAFPQYHGPCLDEAGRRLQSLGYRVTPGPLARLCPSRPAPSLETALRDFRLEAGLPLTTSGLDRPAWDALDELRGLERDIDAARWRDPEGHFLPAMRRAIDARVRELTWRLPLFTRWPRAAPDQATIDELLRAADYLLPGTLAPAGQPLSGASTLAGEPLSEGLVPAGQALSGDRARALGDAIVPVLLSRDGLSRAARAGLQTSTASRKLRRLYTSLRDVEHDILGVPTGALDAAVDSAIDSASRSADRHVARWLGALLDRPETRRAPTPAEIRELWPGVESVVYGTTSIAARWQVFVARADNLWRGETWGWGFLRQALSELQADGRALGTDLHRVVEAAGAELAGVARNNVFRVLYHGLAGVFQTAHLAAARLVAHMDARDRGPIVLRRSFARPRLVVSRHLSPGAARDYLARVARDDRTLALAAEILGILVGITAAWPTGPFGAGVVIVTLTRDIPRLLDLGRELASLWTADPPESGEQDGATEIAPPATAS